MTRKLDITENFSLGATIIRERVALEVSDGVHSQFFAFTDADAALRLADDIRAAVDRLSKESLNQAPVRAVEKWLNDATGGTP